jgi:hypothetical protein
VFYRNVAFRDPEVSSIYIAQHRPVTATIELPAHAISQPSSLDTAYG